MGDKGWIFRKPLRFGLHFNHEYLKMMWLNNHIIVNYT